MALRWLCIVTAAGMAAAQSNIARLFQCDVGASTQLWTRGPGSEIVQHVGGACLDVAVRRLVAAALRAAPCLSRALCCSFMKLHQGRLCGRFRVTQATPILRTKTKLGPSTQTARLRSLCLACVSMLPVRMFLIKRQL